MVGPRRLGKTWVFSINRRAKVLHNDYHRVRDMQTAQGISESDKFYKKTTIQNQSSYTIIHVYDALEKATKHQQ